MAIVRLRPEDLKRALDEGALSLQFQPQVHVPSGKLVGIEAFARWPHPAHGMIGPSDIVPLLDQGSLHVEFDRWVLRALCAQVLAWRGECVSVPLVAANVWTHTLQRPDVAEMVRDVIASSGIAPGDVEIECPRGSVGDPAIADAASGFDTLKIGYPLARDLTLLGSESLEAVQAIVEAARVTGARVVADSVETKDQEDLLVQFGCVIVQGRLYGPEVAPDELKTLLASSITH